jgi:formate C-acetyltransferase
MKYDIIHPLVYARLSKNSPEDFAKLCADFVVNGKNRAQLLCDEAIINALIENGVSETDAADYVCGGCMEVGIQGRTSDFLFNGYHNLPKLLELCMTGGYSITDQNKLAHFHHKPLTEFDTFEDFYASFINEAKRVYTLHLDFQDMLSAYSEEMRPAYLQSSMIDDCLAKGRNMHGGGARYHDYGSSVIGLPNVADSLTALKIAVFDEKICTAEELLDALKADFEGYEELRKKLLALPKYGREQAEADTMAARVAADLNRIFAGYVNRFGGNGKLVMLTFVWGPVAGGILGATPDGRRAKKPVAHSVTPQGMSMTEGITAAMNSCCTLPFELFSGAASTMWDLDPSIATPDYIAALIKSFFSMEGQIFQGNMTDVEELKRALDTPEAYKHLIVRVGGYSARFVNLKKELQLEIIERMRHKR